MKRDRAFAKLVARLYRDLQVLFDKLRLRCACLEGQNTVLRERLKRAEDRLADEQLANAYLAEDLDEALDVADHRKRIINDLSGIEEALPGILDEVRKPDPFAGIVVPDHLPEKLR